MCLWEHCTTSQHFSNQIGHLHLYFLFHIGFHTVLPFYPNCFTNPTSQRHSLTERKAVLSNFETEFPWAISPLAFQVLMHFFSRFLCPSHDMVCCCALWHLGAQSRNHGRDPHPLWLIFLLSLQKPLEKKLFINHSPSHCPLIFALQHYTEAVFIKITTETSLPNLMEAPRV